MCVHVHVCFDGVFFKVYLHVFTCACMLSMASFKVYMHLCACTYACVYVCMHIQLYRSSFHRHICA
jgi:hypothetical protein